MKQNSRKIAVILSYITIILQAIVGIIYVPLLLGRLGSSEYGVYQLMGSLIAYFSIMDFGLSSAVIRYYSKYLILNDEYNKENILGISRRLYAVVTVVLVLIAFVFYLNMNGIFENSLSSFELAESKKIFILLIFNIMITLMTNIHTAVITAHEDFIFLKMLSIIQVVLQPILVLSLITVQPHAYMVALIQTLLNLVVGLIKVYKAHSKLHMKCKFHSFDKSLFSGLINLSLSVFVISIVDQVFWKSNQFILGVISGTAAVTLYSIAAQIYLNYMPLSSTIQGVFLPHISKMITIGITDKELSQYFIRIGRLQFIVLSLVLTGFIVFGYEFIGLWTQPKYQSAYFIAVLILVPFTIDLIQNIGLAIMQAKDLYSDRAKIYALIAIVNVIMAIILGKMYGAIGCAVATSIAMFLGNGIIMNIYYAKKVKLDIIAFWHNILGFAPSLIVVMLFGFAMKHFFIVSGWMVLFIEIIIFTFVYCVALWLFALNKSEKDLILTVAHKVTRH